MLLKAIELDEKLVERLLGVVLVFRTPLAPDGVELVDEDDGRRILAGRGEELSNPASPDADEHFVKLGARSDKKLLSSLVSHDDVDCECGSTHDASFPCDGSRKKRLASPGWTCRDRQLQPV